MHPLRKQNLWVQKSEREQRGLRRDAAKKIISKKLKLLVINFKNQNMKVISLKDVEKSRVTMEGVKDAWKQIPLSKNDGAPVYAYRVFTVEPGGFTPYHQHNYEHMNYIIEGEGVLVNEAGEQKHLKSGDFALVNPNEKHQYRNVSSDKNFVMICGVPKEFE